MGRYLRFEYLYIDTVCSEVTVDRELRTVTCVNHTDTVYMQFLGKNEPTIDNVMRMMRSRCFPEGRPDVKVLLSMLGLNTYNPLDICMKTHGRLTGDKFWIRFEGEEQLTWSDVS